MTPQQIVALGIRLIALYLAYYGLNILLALPVSMKSLNSAYPTDFYYITGGLTLVFAIILWYFPLLIANRLVPRTKAENQLHLQAFEAARVGCSLLGLWMFISVLPSMIWFCAVNLIASDGQSFMRYLDTRGKLELAFYIGKLIFSLILIFRSHDFSRIVLRPPSNAGNDD